MKQAQIQHVFGFILVGIVIVATVLLSVRLVTNVSDTACETEKSRFAQTLREIQETYDTRGVRQEETIRIPCGAEAICFVGEEPQSGAYTTDNLPVSERTKVLLNQTAELESETKDTVYLVQDDVLEPVGAFPKITNNNILCKENRGGAQILFEGTGFGVEVS